MNCKSNNDIESILKEKDIHNKYSDSYENNRYINSALNMEIDFTPLWKIIVNYENLDEYQKKLFDYFDSSIGEVIFVGYNESKKIGVRCIVENLGYSNLEYKNLIKENNAIEFKTYKVNFTKEEEIILPNISGINMVYSVEINPHNVFIYNTLLFKKESFNIRLDFWCKDKKYQEAENEIKEIFNSIDFFVFQKKEEKKDSNVKIEFKDSK
ncbi:MAG TPA: hypothetical protein PLE45_08915 [Spirochaetota bacterium]|nr:hypothetical protein [Spirochaetota bacterium]HOL57841.1 hypothetical protein [Spirochaetota bacterium]